jgi:hypothetical protein
MIKLNSPSPCHAIRPGSLDSNKKSSQTSEKFEIDRETLEHLPSQLHRMVAEKMIRDGIWALKENITKEEKGG